MSLIALENFEPITRLMPLRARVQTTQITQISKTPIIYPDSDGKPMADNTKQFELIFTIHTGIAGMFAARRDVFVAGDLLWYPVEGNNKLRVAPDVMVAFGRPPGHRGSYQQWREQNIPPQVVFEILSPGNTVKEMTGKLHFYEKYRVEEYYLYDPDRGRLNGWLRQSQLLEKIPNMEGWVSPRMGIHFHLEGINLVIFQPNGERFDTAMEMKQRVLAALQSAEAAEQRAEVERQCAEIERQHSLAAEQRANEERQRADEERQRAEVERQRADEERQRAEAERQRAEAEHQYALAAQQRVQRLAEHLRALGIDPEAI